MQCSIDGQRQSDIRLGLCCVFRDEPIKFRNTTASVNSRLSRSDGLAKIAELCAHNAESLKAAIRYCAENGIGCFRINSQVMPLRTHPQLGYDPTDLPNGEAIVAAFRACGSLAAERNIRLSFHPDQFVVLNSRRPEVVEASLREIEYQAEVAEWVGADVVNVHAGGAFGDKASALAAFASNLSLLSDRARRILTVENDDTTYTPADLLPICRAEEVPLVYDVHHHRCNPDSMRVEEATEDAIATWNREPLFHISSPIGGWAGAQSRRHHDYIDIADFPTCWHGRRITIEVEAKAKELAVLQLKKVVSAALCTSTISADGSDGRNDQT